MCSPARARSRVPCGHMMSLDQIRIEFRTRTLGIAPKAHIRYTVAVPTFSLSATSRTVSNSGSRGPRRRSDPRRSVSRADDPGLGAVASAVAKSFETAVKMPFACDPAAAPPPILTRACDSCPPSAIASPAICEPHVGGSTSLLARRDIAASEAPFVVVAPRE
jgi:hypothetical protein